MKKKIALILIAAMVMTLCSCMFEQPKKEISIPTWVQGSWRYMGETSLEVTKTEVFHYGNNYLNSLLYDSFKESERTEGDVKIYEVTTFYKGQELINIEFRLSSNEKLSMTPKTSGTKHTFTFTR